MADVIIHKDYKPLLDLKETEKAIKFIKDFFQDNLAASLSLQRVSAPLFVRSGSGINDDLNGIERKVGFEIKADSSRAEVVFSLAKWKRMALGDYGFDNGTGLYTDMNAIRPDEEVLDNLHSIYVDQWDWERVVSEEQRNLDYLKEVVRKIYKVLKQTEQATFEKYSMIKPALPEEITFLHSEDLAREFPDLSPKEREDKVAKKYGAVFVIGIGGDLGDGQIHDGRAPDYDDWVSETVDGKRGLNGDILLWYPLLDRAFEISSMGIRVDKRALERQLEIRGASDRLEQLWHKKLVNGEMPLSIGGGIGQSRLCMFFLKKMHIGEVHSSIWPADTIEQCRLGGVQLL